MQLTRERLEAYIRSRFGADAWLRAVRAEQAAGGSEGLKAFGYGVPLRLTGIPGSGKTTLARALCSRLSQEGVAVERLVAFVQTSLEPAGNRGPGETGARG
jgi:hypothetical protein